MVEEYHFAQALACVCAVASCSFVDAELMARRGHCALYYSPPPSLSHLGCLYIVINRSPFSYSSEIGNENCFKEFSSNDN